VSHSCTLNRQAHTQAHASKQKGKGKKTKGRGRGREELSEQEWVLMPPSKFYKKLACHFIPFHYPNKTPNILRLDYLSNPYNKYNGVL
jgi:hypothetical protein